MHTNNWRIIASGAAKGKLGQEVRLTRGGGDKGSRTPDLLNAIETLYQLSYIPNKKEVARIISYPRAVVNGELSRSFRR